MRDISDAVNEIFPSGIATLGPKGTDSENAARILMEREKISGRVILCDSFHSARDTAIDQNAYLLVPAAFCNRDSDGSITETNLRQAHLFARQELEPLEA